MIIEVKRSCLEAIQRIEMKLSQIKEKNRSVLPKNICQPLFSISNEITLLKDNFILVMNKVMRLQSKSNKNQELYQQIEADYRTRYDQLSQNYKLLQAKHQKLGKQLNFVKYSNKNLRKELLEHQNETNQIIQLRSTLFEIKELAITNSQNLIDKISNMVQNVTRNSQQNPQQFQQIGLIKIESSPQNISRENLSLKKQIQVRTQSKQKKLFNSCDLHENSSEKVKALRTKKKSFNHKQATHQPKQPENPISQKKTKLELARLIEQQSRLAKIHERYMSTNIV